MRAPLFKSYFPDGSAPPPSPTDAAACAARSATASESNPATPHQNSKIPSPGRKNSRAIARRHSGPVCVSMTACFSTANASR